MIKLKRPFSTVYALSVSGIVFISAFIFLSLFSLLCGIDIDVVLKVTATCILLGSFITFPLLMIICGEWNFDR